MEDWDILIYLRLKRNWMVLSAYSREDYKLFFDKEFTDDEWIDFVNFACDAWSEHSEEETMETILDIFEDEK